jgi:hypothetical protein
MSVKCFLIEPAGKLRRSLRRYHSIAEGEPTCPLNPPQPNWRGYHNASVPFEVVEDPDATGIISQGDDGPLHDDARWPKACGCGYVFAEDDEWQVFVERVYRRADTGEETTHRDAGPGAMFDANWYHGHPCWEGPDGRSLVVILPNGNPWHIDGMANNCTDREGAMEGRHKCWVRHGEPPDLTVDKNGVTCSAGAGSIQSGDWHGFLRGGFLVAC